MAAVKTWWQPLLICLGLLITVSSGDLYAKFIDSSRDPWKHFVSQAEEDYGELGRRAAEYLEKYRPKEDAELSAEFLLENLKLALKARHEFLWCQQLTERQFFNDVLPYAVLDEARDPWRQSFYLMARAIVKDCSTAGEAAQALNQHFFNKINVHYNTKRSKPNQSPRESIAQSRATCTGLSIILVDACRSVGVAARIAGIPLWPNTPGNHNWVEIFDEGRWKFLGADEFDAQGLDRGWFKKATELAQIDNWKHSIWASSWAKIEHHFPMVWDLKNKQVGGINVTDRYAVKSAAATLATVGVRVLAKANGSRLVATVELLDSLGQVKQSVITKSGRADMNDMPTLKLQPNKAVNIRIRWQGQQRSLLHRATAGSSTLSFVWDDLSTDSTAIQEVKRWLALLPEERHLSIPSSVLNRAEAVESGLLIWQKLSTELRSRRRAEHDAKLLTMGNKSMKFLEKVFGQEPAAGHSLWISMHGGGGTRAEVNDQQWRNQIALYQPQEGIYVAPRAPSNTWNLWHESSIDSLFDRLIENYILLRGVDPNRVYLMGYSAGGDGVYQLAPRMADRFAAAAMMAGHPNDASPLGLRNLPFAIFMGGKDHAYKRNQVALKWGKLLNNLRKEDPAGYRHWLKIYPECGHWMQKKDAESLPWLAASQRNPWPKKVVWQQSGRTHSRFYWLKNEHPKKGEMLIAEVEGQAIRIQSRNGVAEKLTLRLSDQLLDLNLPIRVLVNGKAIFKGKARRSVEAIFNSITERSDPASVATAELIIELPKDSSRIRL